MSLHFEGFELDAGRYELRRGEEVLKLEPKAFDLLSYLVGQRERVVSKEELLERVWPGQFVSESVLPSNIRTLRRALGDDRSGQRFIKTVYGRGYQFVAALEGADGAPPGSVGGIPFVGRRAILETLEELLAGSLEGRGGLALVAGEPGIGKTRTLEELGRLVRERGSRVLPGASYEGDGAPAFWPWIQVLRASLREGDPARLVAEIGRGGVEVAQLVPELRDVLPELPPAPAGASAPLRFRLFDAVSGFLRRASERQPLAVLIDDLHWADESSLLLLRFAAHELRDARVLVVGTYRDEELRRGHPLSRALGAIVREPHCRRIRLRGLDPADVATYVRSVAGADASEAVIDSLHSRSDGNPFFLAEILQLMLREGGLDACAGEGSPTTLLPEGIRDAIGRRLDQLSEDCNRMLSNAAFLGAEFSVAPLEQLVELPRERVLELLDEARGLGVLNEVPRSVGHYAFTHELVRETLCEEVSTPLRTLTHRRAGEVLEEFHRGDPGPALAEIANHYFEAAAGGTIDKAVEFGRRAAEHAMALLAWEKAAYHYERTLEALDLSPAPDPRLRCELLLALGHAHSRAGERDRARTSFGRAGTTAQELADPVQLAHAALGLAGRGEVTPAPDEEACKLIQEALAGLGQGPEHEAWRAGLLARLSSLHPYGSKVEQRDALTLEALELARSSETRWALIHALQARASMLLPTAITERLAIGSELLAMAPPSVDVPEAGIYQPAWVGHGYRYSALLALGDLPAADLELVALARLADEQREPFQLFEISLARFGRALGAGRFEEARDWIQRGRGLAERITPISRHLFHLQEFFLARECGPDQLPRILSNPSDLETRRMIPFDIYGWRDPRSGDVAGLAQIWASLEAELPWLVPLASVLVAQARVLQGDADAAARELQPLVARGFGDLPRDASWLLILGLAADVVAYTGDRESSRSIYDLLAPHADQNLVYPWIFTYLGSVSYFLGCLAHTLGWEDEARTHLEAALAMNQRLQSPPQVARTQRALAPLLRDAGESGRADDLDAQARATAAELSLGLNG